MKIEFKHSNLAPDVDNDKYAIASAIDDILTNISDKVYNGYEYGVIMDINGNKVGNWTLED